MKVFKYPLVHDDLQTVLLPKDARILHIQEQHGAFMLWALVDPDAPTERRAIRIAGTGHEIDLGHNLRHISTFGFGGSGLIFHAFEVLP